MTGEPVSQSPIALAVLGSGAVDDRDPGMGTSTEPDSATAPVVEPRLLLAVGPHPRCLPSRPIGGDDTEVLVGDRHGLAPPAPIGPRPLGAQRHKAVPLRIEQQLAVTLDKGDRAIREAEIGVVRHLGRPCGPDGCSWRRRPRPAEEQGDDGN